MISDQRPTITVPRTRAIELAWFSAKQRPLRREDLSKEAQAQRDKALAQKDVLSKQISETARSLAFGAVASCYALLLANKDLAALFISARDALLLVAALGTTAIVLDAAQYVFGYINVRRALQRKDQKYPEDWSMSGRQACFFLKQLFSYSSAVLLLVVIASRVV